VRWLTPERGTQALVGPHIFFGKKKSMRVVRDPFRRRRH